MIRIVDAIGPGFESEEEINQEIEKSSKEAIWGIELRADILSKLKQKIHLEELAEKCREHNLMTIITNASFNETILNLADYASIEIDEFEKYKNLDFSRTKLIVSYHNYEETPKKHVLERKYNEIKEISPYIAKIVTKANKYEDNFLIYDLIIKAREEEQEIIGLCMGEKGSVSRIQAPLFGSFLTFACVDKQRATAPGQLTVREMKQIYGLLNVDINKKESLT